MTDKPRRKRRLLGAGLIGAAIFLVLALLRCGADFGLGGSGQDQGSDTIDASLTDASKPASSDATIAAAEVSSDAAGPSRCVLRLDGDGLTIDGVPAAIDDAVTACQEVGSADLTVTGDAAFGTAESLRQALERAGIEVYER